MFSRWINRWRWRRSRAFDEAVVLAVDQAREWGRGDPVDYARRRARRRQSVRRKWVWQAAANRLRAEQRSAAAPLAAGPDAETS